MLLMYCIFCVQKSITSIVKTHLKIREMNEPSRLAYKLTSRLNRSAKLVSICSLFTPLINQ